MSTLLEPKGPTKRQKILTSLMAVALGIAAIGVGVMLYWAAASTEVFEIKNAPVPVRAIEQNGDRLIIITVDYCKNIEVNGTARVSFVSESNEVFLPVGEEKSPARCGADDFPIILPKNLPPDEYQIKFRLTYDLNPLKRGVVEEFESKPFIVTKGGAKLKDAE